MGGTGTSGTAAPSPGEDQDWAPTLGDRHRYLLHSGTEDITALVVGNLDRAQELHPELVHPVAVSGQAWKQEGSEVLCLKDISKRLNSVF